ncbi:MAG TPA: amidohydrolase family protein, partial [Actinomycetota bacterium]|nr:amidohydrolase family protein [Actinomycetota bacterium]
MTIDLLIANARIVDGTGAAPTEGAVAVEGNRIAQVVRAGQPTPEVRRVVDAGGHVLAPGFVDVHEHSDLSPFVEPAMESMLRQGVTSVVVGNCGASVYPVEGAREVAALVGADPADLGLDWRTFGAYLGRVEAERPAVNVAALVGHGALRLRALGADQRRRPSPDEMERMQRSLASALEEGAVGLSTGLIYSPGQHAETEEIVELAAVLADRGGVYASHVRGEGGRVFEAVAECIRIGRRAGVPSHVSHLKVEGPAMWGKSRALLALIDAERASGADVTADQYPYTAWETELASALPPWVTPDELPEVLADPPQRERLRASIAEGEPGWETLGLTIGWDRVMLGSFTSDPALTGRSIEAIASDLGVEPWEALAELLI